MQFGNIILTVLSTSNFYGISVLKYFLVSHANLRGKSMSIHIAMLVSIATQNMWSVVYNTSRRSVCIEPFVSVYFACKIVGYTCLLYGTISQVGGWCNYHSGVSAICYE